MTENSVLPEYYEEIKRVIPLSRQMICRADSFESKKRKYYKLHKENLIVKLT